MLLKAQRSNDFQSIIVQIMTEDMETAADIVQELASHLGIDQLEATCTFSRAAEKLRGITDTVK